MTNELIVKGGGGESKKGLGPWGVLGRWPLSPVRKDLMQALFLVKSHLLFFFLEAVIFACDDEIGGANT